MPEENLEETPVGGSSEPPSPGEEKSAADLRPAGFAQRLRLLFRSRTRKPQGAAPLPPLTPDSLDRPGKGERCWRWGFDGAVVLLLLAIGALAYNKMVANYFRMRLPWEEDQGIFNHLMWNISHRLSWENTIIYRCPSYLANHFSVIYGPISLIHALLPDPRTLFLISLAVVLCGVFFLYRVALQRLMNRPAALILIILLLTHRAMISNVLVNGFRDLFLAFGFLCIALWGFERRKFWPFVAGVVLAAMCKEDMPMLVIGFALPAFVQRRTWRWRLFPLLFGISYTVVVFAAMKQIGHVWWKQDFAGYAYLGNTPGEMVSNAVHHPSRWLREIVRPEKFECFKQLLGPFGFLAILAPEFLLIPASQYAQLMLNSRGSVWNVDYQYIAPIVPFVFVASVVGLGRAVKLAKYIMRRLPWFRVSEGESRRLRIAIYALTLLVAAGLMARAGQPVRSTFAGFSNYRNWMFFGRPSWEDPRRLALEKHVPDSAVVCAQSAFVLTLCMRPYIYCFPHEFDKSDYIVVDVDPKSNYWPAKKNEYQSLLAALNDPVRFSLEPVS